ncbi:MAG: hypothetical protein ABI720_02940 [Actinomycetes bacterium]
MPSPTPSLRATTWMAWLFVIGSACFAVGVPMSLNTSWAPTISAAVFFVGSVFFTAASSVQLRLAWRAGEDAQGATTIGALLSRAPAWTSSWVQWIGTVFFNVTTVAAWIDVAGVEAVSNQVIWRPDAVGSLLFLVSSAISLMPDVRRHRHGHVRDRSWTISVLNMVGSIFFGISAMGAYVIPASNELLNASWANSGTFVGALCFLAGAWLVIPRRTGARDESRDSDGRISR